MKYGYDPIQLKKQNIQVWLDDDTDNILIMLKGFKVRHNELCLKKSYFLNPHMKDIYKYCSINNDALMINETYKSKDFLELGYYFGNYMVVDRKEFIKVLKRKMNRAFLITPSGIRKELTVKFPQTAVPGDIVTVKYFNEYYKVMVPDGVDLSQSLTFDYDLQQPTFISQEKLELSQVGLKKLPKKMQLTTVKITAAIPEFPKHEYDKLKSMFELLGHEKVGVSKKIRYKLPKDTYAKIYYAFFYFSSLDELNKTYALFSTTPSSKFPAELYLNDFKTNLPYQEQVYFDKVIAEALYDYSLPVGWDSAINTYLRTGDEYFKKKAFLDKLTVFGYPNYKAKELEVYNGLVDPLKGVAVLAKYSIALSSATPPQKELNIKLTQLLKDFAKAHTDYGINKVKDKILSIDKCFMEVAPTVTSLMASKKYYRGMIGKYNFTGVGSSIILKNFTSVSEQQHIAKQFGIMKSTAQDEAGKACCLFEFTLEEGLPYVNMINTTRFKSEREILLPRDIKATLNKISAGGQIKTRIRENGKLVSKTLSYDIYHIYVSKTRPDQFAEVDEKGNSFKLRKSIGSCNEFLVGKIEKVKLKGLLTSKTPPPTDEEKKMKEVIVQMAPKNVETNLDENLHKLKLPRCPKGTRRNPKTKKCEPYKEKSNNKTKKVVNIECKGLSMEDCNKKDGCSYTKGTKRNYCRRAKNK